MAPTVERVQEIGSLMIGEGPHWDTETQSLYFVDIVGKSVHKYVPSTKKHTHLKFDQPISFVIPVKGCSNRFVISMKREIAVITWDGVSSTPSKIETIVTLDSDFENNTINDAKVDSLGNLWVGTLASNADIITGTPANGSLYSFGSDKRVKKHVSDISLSNGLAFRKDLKKMYFIDSVLKRVDQFDYDVKTMSISNRQPLFTFEKHGISGFPDGQAIDADDNLWVASFQGDKIIKIDTHKSENLLGTVHIPEHQVTSLAFGGPHLDELYVTTGAMKIPGTTSEKTTNGYVYKVTGLGVKGLAGESMAV